MGSAFDELRAKILEERSAKQPVKPVGITDTAPARPAAPAVKAQTTGEEYVAELARKAAEIPDVPSVFAPPVERVMDTPASQRTGMELLNRQYETAPNLHPGQYGAGAYGEKNLVNVERDLTAQYEEHLRSAALRSGKTLDDELATKLKDEAKARAHREAVQVFGTSERRGNALVAKDIPGLYQAIQDGNTWLGMLDGQWQLHHAQDLVGTGNNPVVKGITAAVDTALGPMNAIAKLGASAADVQSGEDISKPQRESKIGWLLRASPLQPVMAYLHGPDSMEWNSQEHIDKTLGYDYTQDWYKTGEAVYGWTPEVMRPFVEALVNPLSVVDRAAGTHMLNSDVEFMTGQKGISDQEARKEAATASLGLATTGLLIWFDPDVLSLSTMGVGKALGGVAKSGALVNKAIVAPAIRGAKEMIGMVDAGEEFERIGSHIVQKYGINSVEHRAYQAAIANTVGRIDSELHAGLGANEMSNFRALFNKFMASEASAAAKMSQASSAATGAEASAKAVHAGVVGDVGAKAGDVAAASAAEASRAAQAVAARSQAARDANISAMRASRDVVNRAKDFWDLYYAGHRAKAMYEEAMAKAVEVSGHLGQYRTVQEMDAAVGAMVKSGTPLDVARTIVDSRVARTSADEMERLLGEASKSKHTLKSLDARVKFLIESRKSPSIDVNYLQVIDEELASLSKVRRALLVRELATGRTLTIHKMVRDAMAARKGQRGLAKMAALKWGMDEAKLESAAEQAMHAANGAKRAPAPPDIAAAALKAGKVKIDSAAQAARKAYDKVASREGRAVQAARGATAKAQAALDSATARGAKDLSKAQDLLDRAKRAEARAASRLAEASHRAGRISETKDVFREELNRIIEQGHRFRDLALRAESVAQPFIATKSLSIEAGKGVFDPVSFAAKAVAKYGQDAQPLVDAAKNMPAKLTPQQLAHLLHAEEGVHFAADSRRMAGVSVISKIADQVKLGATPPVRLSAESAAQHALRAITNLSRASNSLRRWGGDNASSAVKSILLKAVHRGGSLATEIDDVARHAGMAGVWQYLTSAQGLHIGDRVALLAGGEVPAAQRAAMYLQRLAATGNDDAWLSDSVVKAIAGAWQPSGKSAEAEAAACSASLRKFMTGTQRTPDELRQWFKNVAPGFFSRALERTDRGQVAERFFYQALAHGSNMYDAVEDYRRLTSGLNLSADVARAMDFLSEPAAGRAEQAVHEAEKASQALGVPLAKSIRNVFLGAENQRKLLSVVSKSEHGEVWMSDAVWRGLHSIPSNLEKELKQFHVAGTPAEYAIRGVSQYLQAWRLGVLFGSVVPRPGMFLVSEVGDWSQMALRVGFTAASRITAETLVTNIPFIGRALQNSLSDAARSNSLLRLIWDPNLASVLHGRGSVEVAEGVMPSAELMREAAAHGIMDAIGSGDLAEISARVSGTSYAKRLAGVFIGTETMPHIKAAASMFEAVSLRRRLALYLEARTGRLTGKKLSGDEAAALVRDTLYDYRAGPTETELNTIGRISAFWVYRRSMLRQLGGMLTEGMSNPDAMYVPRALVGQNQIGRLRKAGVVGNWVPDLFDWSDEKDEWFLDNERADALGMHTAPWWVTNKMWIGNILADSKRRAANKENGRDAPTEALVLNGLVFGDMLYNLNLWAQLGGAMAADAGLVPGVTGADSSKLAEQAIDDFSDSLLPGIDTMVGGMLKATAGIETRQGPTTLATDAAIAYNKLAPILESAGIDGGIFRDKNGKVKLDNSFMGMLDQFVISNPRVADILRNARYVDNPGWRQSPALGVIETLMRGSGVISITPNNAWESRKHEVDAQQRAAKDILSGNRKRMP